ncbi:hypothetical protein [Pseudoalteromonas sp. 31A1]|uniref:hypothetical protein n=1 Tax=Pseudoalteromonas sp. 31A1 TaxID=2686351 RepID=UPI0013FDB4FD|nr:hypothetical protein [Pseudoalteromonas sp. 31A1]
MDGIKNSQIQQIQENIAYQIEKMNFLCNERRKKSHQVITEVAKKMEISRENELANQALTDALLNSMASLIDYYYMYCFMKLGLKSENITKVQYRPINNNYIQTSSSYKEKGCRPSIGFIKEQFDKKITEMSNLELSDIQSLYIHDYWHAFFGEAISKFLLKVGLLSDKFKFEYTSEGFKINNLVKKYHFYMEAFYCNELYSNGAKYNIYLDINNCLKHNIVPYLQTEITNFDDKLMGFLFFNFKNEDSVFLKKGLLKSIVDLDYDELRKILNKLSANEKCSHQDPDIKSLIDIHLKVDKINGYVSHDNARLYFFVDEVLIAKSKDATFVDAVGSLNQTLRSLIEDIKRGIELDLSEFD